MILRLSVVNAAWHEKKAVQSTGDVDDLELPGMWSNSDFTGGETDT